MDALHKVEFLYDINSFLFSIVCPKYMEYGTLKAFKRAAESLEKLLDVTREELPGTMAAVRLSGMEISDLTMELSDLGLAFSIEHSYDVILLPAHISA